MGTSTNAYLYFGFTFYSEEDGEGAPGWLEGEDHNWERVYAARAGGILAPDEEFSDSTKAAYHAYWDKARAAVEACPCTIDTHCYIDSSMWFVALKRTKICARRGYPEEVRLVEPTKAEIKQLKDFCELMGIKWQESRWELASYWG
jgi:hypothetical protein